jgi:hypothetical protein
VVASELVAASNPTISAILQLDWIQTHIPHPKLFQREITEMKNQS